MITEGKKAAKVKLAAVAIFASLLCVLFVSIVDLKPKISPDFFFGSKDPAAIEAEKISALFPSDEFMLLSIEGQNIFADPYYRSVQGLSETLEALPEITRVLSLSNGPASVSKARKSPFWRPLLLDDKETTSFVFLFLSGEDLSLTVNAIEEIATQYETSPGIVRINLSGMPYIAEQIRQNLVQDAKIFSTLALLVFVGLIAWIYRSMMIALGSCVTGLSAIFMTLIILHLIGQPVGILTVNLAIIVYILVQSQIIYLTNNWKRSSLRAGRGDAAGDAVRKTIIPSLWCAATTLLGFASLFLVQAEPLRQLGSGGTIAVFSAFLCYYLIFPVFLSFSHAGEKKHKFSFPLKIKIPATATGFVILLAALVFSIPSLFKLETDPSLFSYFNKETPIYKGLEAVDKNGGSSPLMLVVSLSDGENLDREEGYNKLWNLHRSLEKTKQVGTVLSLPALLAEANDHPLAFLIPWREMVTLLSLDINQGVVRSFLADNRNQALFILRMKEGDREKSRAAVIEEIKSKIKAEGFRADLTGGVYFLQGQLSELVKSSVVSGLLSLLLLFGVISLFALKDYRFTISMVLVAAVIPVVTLGSVGFFEMPLDVIAAPAVSVAFGFAVDALIHLGLAVKRKSQNMNFKAAWSGALSEQSAGILAASGIMIIGFLIFALSGFPPTNRFGLILVGGAVLAALVSLCALSPVSRFLNRR
ncbi:MAG: MMPL family transporter [Sneathiellales bacterium]|nr:MMPL family transporter [Sneathiellales bacterium]